MLICVYYKVVFFRIYLIFRRQWCSLKRWQIDEEVPVASEFPTSRLPSGTYHSHGGWAVTLKMTTPILETTPDVIAQFVIKYLPTSSLIYFFCRGGRFRPSSFKHQIFSFKIKIGIYIFVIFQLDLWCDWSVWDHWLHFSIAASLRASLFFIISYMLFKLLFSNILLIFN